MTTTKADRIVDRGAELLRELSEKARAQGGLGARLAPMLAEDSAFLRKLKPSLVAARIRGQAPTTAARRRRRRGRPRSIPESVPITVVALAFVAGVVAAKLIDWRGHAHPRD